MKQYLMLLQEAVDGVYKLIGDGLRRDPNLLTSD